jgi:hypothetical protein
MHCPLKNDLLQPTSVLLRHFDASVIVNEILEVTVKRV